MTQQTVDALFEVKRLDQAGAFSGYASLFDAVDRSRDVVARGAFKNTLAVWRARGQLPAMLWQHDAAEPIGVWREMREDARGLFVAGRLFIDDIPRARQAYALLKEGALTGLSIGFRAGEAAIDEAARVRRLIEIELFEVSLVTFPALDEARVATVKRADEITTIREFEAFLRDVGGYSHTAAKAIASGGFKAKPDPREEAVGLIDMVRAHQRRLDHLTNLMTRVET